MPLEATMLIIDNSEYMRNGDYQPTRFEAQSDAVNVVFQTKIDSNPENTVGIMTMAGKGCVPNHLGSMRNVRLIGYFPLPPPCPTFCNPILHPSLAQKSS
jgi:hypothetical protein